MTHFIGQLSKVVNPAGAALVKAAPSNTLVKFLQPDAAVSARLRSGEGGTAKVLADPGGFFTQTETQQKAQQASQAAALAAVPRAANQDTAANAAQQQSDYLRRRRGVFANIFAGGQPNTTPVTANKSLLGT